MDVQYPDIARFCLLGINYQKADAVIRSLFAVDESRHGLILQAAAAHNIRECFVLSTCNRTEIYGLADDPMLLAGLLCAQTEGDIQTFRQIACVKTGDAAIRHFFRVAAGLDSQILGDYEIVGQIKQAVQFAKKHGGIGAFLERLANTALQSSKKIKTATTISDGTVSVSFAVVQYLRENLRNLEDKKLVLIGTGKFGRNTCKNLVEYTGIRNITLLNRTESRAAQVAEEFGLASAPMTELPARIAAADIILAATDAQEPIIHKAHLEGLGAKMVIDLSIPYNVDTEARQLPNVTLVNVDELSRIKDETLSRREAELPKAEAIIETHIAEFGEWVHLRRHAPVLRAVKSKLTELHRSPMLESWYHRTGQRPDAEAAIHRIVRQTATQLRAHNRQGCHYLQAINAFIAQAISLSSAGAPCQSADWLP